MGTYGDLVWMDGFDGYRNVSDASTAYVSPTSLGALYSGINNRWGNNTDIAIGQSAQSIYQDADLSAGFYLGAAIYSTTTFFELHLLDSGDTDANPNYQFRCDVNKNQTILYMQNGSNPSLTYNNANLINNVWNFLEIKCFPHATTGWIKIRANEKIIFEADNLHTLAAGHSWGRYRIYLGNCRMDDFYMFTNSPDNKWLGDCHITISSPTGNGNKTDFSGNPNTTNTYLNIDEFPFNISDYNYSNQSGAIDAFLFNFSGAKKIHGIKFQTYCTIDNGYSITSIVSGSGFSSNYNYNFGQSTGYKLAIFAKNPITMSGWGDSESVKDLQFGYQLN